MALLTLLDIVKRNGSDAEVGLVDEAVKAVPEVSGKSIIGAKVIVLPNIGSARTIKGLNYKTLIRTALPSVSFRDANQGTAGTKGTYENRMVETYIMNPNWGGDRAVLDKSEDGPLAHMALEAGAHTEAAFQTIGKCFYYGQNATYGDVKAFPGLLDVYDSTNMVVDAGGTTAATASSVWAVKFGPRFVQWVYGANGQFELTDVETRPATDLSGNEFTKYYQELYCYPGLQVSSHLCVGRIKKLTADSGKGLTDALLGSLLSKFNLAFQPDAFFMSKRSREQLRASRTTYNATGAEAPLPEEFQGIPIVATESIIDTEALTL